MKGVCYECYETGCITEKETELAAQFVTAKKYEVLYAEELPRFRKQPLNIYALPYADRPIKAYHGTDRMGLHLTDKLRDKLTREEKRLVKRCKHNYSFVDDLMQRESTAQQFVSLFQNAADFELIWIRNSGIVCDIPKGYEFIGYDISDSCDYAGGFSIICDCMFICRWHGCDIEGALFLSDFNKLNQHGLFPDWRSAYDYMVKYLKEDWTERGEYCILEVFRKSQP